MSMETVINAATGETYQREPVYSPDPPAKTVEQLRAGMVCSRMQGILAMGEDAWGKVLEYRATATWAEQIVIDDAGDWFRNSQNIAFFGYLLGLSDDEIDALFETAMTIVA